AHVHAEPHADRGRPKDSGAVPVRRHGAEHQHEHSGAECAAGAQCERSRQHDVGRHGRGVPRAMNAGSGKREEGSGGMRIRRFVIAVAAMIVASGCYEYHDGRISDLRPNTTVHVVLSADATTSLASVIGPNATAVDGQVVSIDTSTM